MTSAVTPVSAAREPRTAADIADSLEMLAEEGRLLQLEFDGINGLGTLISRECANRLVAIGERISTAAAVREHLANLDPQMLQDGIALSMNRKFPEMFDTSS